MVAAGNFIQRLHLALGLNSLQQPVGETPVQLSIESTRASRLLIAMAIGYRDSDLPQPATSTQPELPFSALRCMAENRIEGHDATEDTVPLAILYVIQTGATLAVLLSQSRPYR
jgi:hypothetical protein